MVTAAPAGGAATEHQTRSGVPGADSAVAGIIQFRTGNTVHRLAAAQVGIAHLEQMEQWRDFTWHPKQRHFPGSYWSATMGDFVAYESRTELARLTIADFDTTVRAIVSQPFELIYQADKPRRHIPDYLLLGVDDSVRIVNVKTERSLAVEKVQQTLAVAARSFAALGWTHEVWTHEQPTRWANIELLAGYRRAWLFSPELTRRVLALADGRTIGETAQIASLDTTPELVKPSIFHLLWTQQLRADLDEPLESTTRLAAAR